MKFFSLLFSTLFLLSANSALLAQENETQEEIDEAAQEVEQEVDEVVNFVDRNFVFGLKAGLNFSTFNDAEILNPDMQTRLHIGAFSRFLFTDRLSAKVELLYSMQGARADEFSIFEDYQVELNYLSLPIMAEFGITQNIRLELGPYIAVLLSNRQSFQELQENVEQIDVDNDDTNFVDVGLGAGITYTANSGVGIGLRYKQGFADALGDDFFQDASGSNSVIQLSGYYQF